MRIISARQARSKQPPNQYLYASSTPPVWPYVVMGVVVLHDFILIATVATVIAVTA